MLVSTRNTNKQGVNPTNRSNNSQAQNNFKPIRTNFFRSTGQTLSLKSYIINKNKEKKKQSIIKMTHLYQTMKNLIKKTTRVIIVKIFNNLLISTSPALPHVITTNPPLKILIDSGASSSIMNPEIAYKLFSKCIFPHEFEI